MKSILAPHKEQDGWVYVRELRSEALPYMRMDEGYVVQNLYEPGGASMSYRDHMPTSRVISSRRVEEAVETADYLKRCAEDGVDAVYRATGQWWVLRWAEEFSERHAIRAALGSTLREAYHRYHNAKAQS